MNNIKKFYSTFMSNKTYKIATIAFIAGLFISCLLSGMHGGRRHGDMHRGDRHNSDMGRMDGDFGDETDEDNKNNWKDVGRKVGKEKMHAQSPFEIWLDAQETKFDNLVKSIVGEKVYTFFDRPDRKDWSKDDGVQNGLNVISTSSQETISPVSATATIK